MPETIAGTTRGTEPGREIKSPRRAAPSTGERPTIVLYSDPIEGQMINLIRTCVDRLRGLGRSEAEIQDFYEDIVAASDYDSATQRIGKHFTVLWV